MATNKEHIENLESELGEVKSGMHRLEGSTADKLQHLEGTLNRLTDLILTNKESSTHHTFDRKDHGSYNRDDSSGERRIFFSKVAKLDFLRFSEDDPIEWFNQVNSFLNFRLFLKKRR